MPTRTLYNYVEINEEGNGHISAQLNEIGLEKIFKELKTISDVVNFVSGFSSAHQIQTTFNISGAGPQTEAADYLAYKVLMNSCFHQIANIMEEFDKETGEPLPTKRQRIFGVIQKED